MKQHPRNKSKMYKVVIAMVVFLLLAWVAFRIFGKNSEPLLSRDQATLAVLSEYPGKVDSLKLQAGAYIAVLQTEQGRYEPEAGRSYRRDSLHRAAEARGRTGGAAYVCRYSSSIWRSLMLPRHQHLPRQRRA